MISLILVKAIDNYNENAKKRIINYLHIINKTNVKAIGINFFENDPLYSGFSDKTNLDPTFCFRDTRINKLLREFIKIKDTFYFHHNNYKYILYIILNNTFKRDIARYILEIMIKENKKIPDNLINSFDNLDYKFLIEQSYENLDDNQNKQFMSDLFDLCGIGDTELEIKL